MHGYVLHRMQPEWSDLYFHAADIADTGSLGCCSRRQRSGTAHEIILLQERVPSLGQCDGTRLVNVSESAFQCARLSVVTGPPRCQSRSKQGTLGRSIGTTTMKMMARRSSRSKCSRRSLRHGHSAADVRGRRGTCRSRSRCGQST